MKKIVSILLALLMLVPVCTFLPSCKSETTPADLTAAETTPASEEPSAPTPTPTPAKTPDPAWRTVNFSGVSAQIPADFKEQKTGEVTLYVPADYPTHSDNVSVTVSNESEGSYTKTNYKASIEAALGSVQDFTYKKDAFDGISRIIASYAYTIYGIPMRAVQYVFFPSSNKVVSFTFTYVSGDCDELFGRIQDSFRIVR